jgi:hypothetical protein
VDTKLIMLPTAVHSTGARRLPEKDRHRVLTPTFTEPDGPAKTP